MLAAGSHCLLLPVVGMHYLDVFYYTRNKQLTRHVMTAFSGSVIDIVSRSLMNDLRNVGR
jgi:hypothetical protein